MLSSSLKTKLQERKDQQRGGGRSNSRRPEGPRTNLNQEQNYPQTEDGKRGWTSRKESCEKKDHRDGKEKEWRGVGGKWANSTAKR